MADKIDMTPTWEGLLPLLLLMLENGSDKTKSVAETELKKMARAADLAVKAQKEGKL